MRYKYLFPILALITLSNYLFAQNDSNRFEFTAIHSLSIFAPGSYKVGGEYKIEGPVWGGELSYHLDMTQNHADYIKALNITSIDIVGSYRSMDNLLINNVPSSKGSLGDAYTVLGRFEIGLIKSGPFQLLFTPGLGVTYSTETYFTDQNPLVGSHLNFAAQAGLKLYAGLTSSTGLIAGIDLLHYSDAAVRVPNSGINSFNVSFGLVQRINKTGPATSKQPFIYPYKNSFEFGGDFGMRGVSQSKDELYRSGLYAGYNYQLSTVLSLKAGLDAGYYFTPFNPNDPSGRTFAQYGTSYDKWRAGISGGIDIDLGRLVVMGAYGYYWHYHSFFNNKTYWTPGLKYYVLPWMALQAKCYIHYTEADYLGWGVLFRVR